VDRAEDAGRGVRPGLEVIAANEDDGRALVFAHEQAGGGGEFVGDGQDGGVQRLLIAILRAPKIDQRGNSGGADGDVGETETPRAGQRCR